MEDLIASWLSSNDDQHVAQPFSKNRHGVKGKSNKFLKWSADDGEVAQSRDNGNFVLYALKGVIPIDIGDFETHTLHQTGKLLAAEGILIEVKPF